MEKYKRFFKDTLQESIQSENELRKFAEYIIRELAVLVFKSIHESEENLDKLQNFRRFYVFFEAGKIKFSNVFLKDFIENLKERDFTFYFFIDPNKNKSFDGIYESRNDRIILYPSSVPKDWNIKISLNEINTYFKQKGYIKTIHHELTHAYDDFISKGHYINKNYKSTTTGSDYADYLNQNLEINAFYSEVASTLNLQNSWEYYFRDFKEKFKNQFTKLKPEFKNQLIKRLYKRWSEPFEVKNIEEYLSGNSNIFFNEIYENGKLDKSIDRRVKNISKAKIDKYLTLTIQKLLSGKIGTSVVNSSDFKENRFYFFKSLSSEIEHIAKYYIDADNSSNPDIKNAILKLVKQKEQGWENIKNYFKLSNDQVEQIIKNLDKIVIKRKR